MKTRSFSKVILTMLIMSFLTISMMTLSACEVKPAEVSQSTLAYDGSKFTWDSATGAKSYKLIINGSKEYTTNETSYVYPASQSATTTEIEIYAVNGKKVSEKTNKTFTKLKTIEQNEINFTPEGMMSWPYIDNASRYIISINGTEQVVDANEFSEFSYGVQNNIKIKPVGFDNSYYSFFSTTIVKNYLATPNNITYDGQYISWRGSYNATSYLVYVDGNEMGTTTRQSIEYNANKSSFEVTIKSIGDGRSYFSSKISDAKLFRYLGTAENLRIDQGKLFWDEVEGADGYSVEVNGTLKTIQENSMAVTSGSEVTVRIKPIATEGEVYYSAYCDSFRFFIMNAPEIKWNSDLKLDGEPASAVWWNAVSGAVSDYRVTIERPDGSVTSLTTGNIPSFKEAYAAVGKYRVKVQTIAGGGTGYYDSGFSNEIEINRLPAPDIERDGITSDANDVGSGFTVRYSSVFGAQGYKLYRDGTETTYTSTLTSMRVNEVIGPNVTASQDISYSIQSLGKPVSYQQKDLIVNLDSISQSTDATAGRFHITVLAMPQNISIDGSTMSWDSIEGVSGYVVDTGSRTGIDRASYSLKSIVSEGNYDIKICAMGNGKNVLSSNYTPETKIKKLPAPTNIRIGTSVNEGQLSWDPIDDAKSIKVYLNGSDQGIDSADIDNINRYIDVSTVTVVMEAVANYWSPDHKLYYVSSNFSTTKQFTKIAPITFQNPTFTNTELKWNTPSNISANSSVSYRLFDESQRLISEGINSTRYSLADLDAGDYMFYIQCIGDGNNLINSEISDPVSITKLATPDVSRTGDGYTWESVTGASSYVVYVDGNIAYTKNHTPGATYEFKPVFTSIKTYSVVIYAVGDGGLNTIDSNPCEYAQVVRQIGLPDFKPSYSMDHFDTSGQIIIEVTKEPANATGYKYMVDGVVITEKTTETIAYFTTKSTGVKVMSLVAYGSCFDSDGIYYIDSLLAGGNNQYAITLLDAPNVSKTDAGLTISLDGKIKWGASTNARGYKVTVYYDDDTSEDFEPKTATITISASKVNKITKIDVQAIGNGTTIISSAVVTYVD